MDKKNFLYIGAAVAVAVVALLVFIVILVPAGPESVEDGYGTETPYGDSGGANTNGQSDNGSGVKESGTNGDGPFDGTATGSRSEFHIYGQVLDMESKSPLEGATIAVETVEAEVEAISDSDGNFSLSAPKADELTIRCRLDGYRKYTLPLINVLGNPPGRRTIYLRKEKAEPRDVTFTVVDYFEKEPVSAVMLIPVKPPGIMPVATDIEGRARITLPAGTYELELSVSSAAYVDRLVSFGSDGEEISNATVITLFPKDGLTASIFGFVLDGETRKPIEGVKVVLSSGDYPVEVGARTDRSGGYSGKVPEGDIWIICEKEEYYLLRFPVCVAEGKAFQASALYMAPIRPIDSAIRGRVISSKTNAPLTSADGEFEIRFKHSLGGFIATVTADESGYYRLDVPEGEFLLTCVAKGFFHYASAEPVVVPRGSVKDFDVVLEPEPERNSTITGRVLDAVSGEVLFGCRIDAVYTTKGLRYPARTNEEGVYTIKVPAGLLHVSAGCTGYITKTQEIEIGYGGYVNNIFKLEKLPED